LQKRTTSHQPDDDYDRVVYLGYDYVYRDRDRALRDRALYDRRDRALYDLYDGRYLDRAFDRDGNYK
ncbi:unnamed protein product, partial [Rotaria magnacalcarata]